MFETFKKFIAGTIIIGLLGPSIVLPIKARGYELPMVDIVGESASQPGGQMSSKTVTEIPTGAKTPEPIPVAEEGNAGFTKGLESDCGTFKLGPLVRSLSGKAKQEELNKAMEEDRRQREIDARGGGFTEGEEKVILGEEVVEATDIFEAVPVADKNTILRLRSIESESVQSKRLLDKLWNKEGCTDVIFNFIGTVLIQKITKSVVDWINSGFEESGPTFLSDPDAFFTSLLQEQIFSFKADLFASNNPFALGFLRGLATALETKFSRNAEYSMNELMAGPTGVGVSFAVQNFYRDFNQGSWDAWLALTQVPYNNAWGFQIEANRELGRRIEGLYRPIGQEIRDTIQAGSGFLGDERCVDDDSITRRKHLQWVSSGGARGAQCPSGIFRYVTPGTLIASQATWTQTSWLRKLELADELRESAAAILDALLNQLVQWGLRGLTEKPEAFETIDLTGPDMFSASAAQPSYIPPYYQNTDWFVTHPDFDITQGIPQAIIDEQRTYVDKLEEQNEGLGDLIKWIYQLDYCIPGPNPGWKEEAQSELNRKLAKIKSIPFIEGIEMTKDQLRVALTESVDSLNLGTTLEGVIVGIVDTLFGISAPIDIVAQTYYSMFLNLFTGILLPKKAVLNMALSAFPPAMPLTAVNNMIREAERIGAGSPIYASLTTKNQFDIVMQYIFDAYVRATDHLYNKYTLFGLPVSEAEKQFNKIEGYKKIITNNEDKIIFQKGIIKRLEALKTEIEGYGNNISESVLSDIGTRFGRLALNLVGGNDISQAFSLLKQTEDEVKYVEKDLLKGTDGCEPNLIALDPYIRDVTRMLYPEEITKIYSLYPYSTTRPRDDFIRLGHTDSINWPRDPGDLDKNKYPATFTQTNPGKETFIELDFIGVGKDNLETAKIFGERLGIW